MPKEIEPISLDAATPLEDGIIYFHWKHPAPQTKDPRGLHSVDISENERERIRKGTPERYRIKHEGDALILREPYETFHSGRLKPNYERTRALPPLKPWRIVSGRDMITDTLLVDEQEPFHPYGNMIRDNQLIIERTDLEKILIALGVGRLLPNQLRFR